MADEANGDAIAAAILPWVTMPNSTTGGTNGRPWTAAENAAYDEGGGWTEGVNAARAVRAGAIAADILAALPALGWIRSPGAGTDGTVVREWAARWVDEVDGPGYTREEAAEQVARNGVPGDMGEVVRRVVWTVTTPDGWTHVSTGPWEVAP